MNNILRHCLAFALLATTLTLRAGVIFPEDTIYTFTTTCAPTEVCIPIPAGSLPDYQIFADGAPYLSGVEGCDLDTIVAYSYNTLLGLGNQGPYHLDSWLVNGQKYEGVFTDIPDLVSLLNAWNPEGNWVNQPATLSIRGGASGTSYSNMKVTAIVSQTPSTIGMNFSLLPQGSSLTFGEGAHTVVAQLNGGSVQDTLTVVVVCLQSPEPTSMADTIAFDGETNTFCLDNSGLPGTPNSIFNACPDASGEYVYFYLDEENYCVKYQALKCNGFGQACIVVCDDLGVCDTTAINIYVDNSGCFSHSSSVADTLLINFSKTYCIQENTLPGAIASATNLCADNSGSSVDFEYDELTNCISYTGFSVGSNQACYLLTDEFGNTDTTYLSVFVRLPETGIIIDTLMPAQSKTYCVDIAELAGNVLSIENFYPASAGNAVSFAIDDLSLCVEAKSLVPGTDTACIRVCDSYGVCDTTYLIVTVLSDVGNPCANSLPPVAVGETVSTQLNTLLNIDILDNDTPGSCPFFSVFLLNGRNGGIGPQHGLIALNLDNSVAYIPNRDYCGLDSFQYVLCNPQGCDTALVVVNVVCIGLADEIVVHSGFSPNGDGINDYFNIENIQFFPANELQVFNRWGKLVYQQKGYKNNWNGSFDQRDLPTGTYFYYLNLGVEGRRYSGYLQLQR